MDRFAATLAVLTLFTISPALGQDYERVSIIRLIAHPEIYNGKRVLVQGYVEIEHEGNAIYLGKVDAENVLSKNAIWLNLTTEQISQWQHISESYASIWGIFIADSHGHFGGFSGSIGEVTRMLAVPDYTLLQKQAAEDRAKIFRMSDRCWSGTAFERLCGWMSLSDPT